MITYSTINYNVLPKEIKDKGQRTYRSITVDGKEIEFSDGFFDLHTKSYDEIIKGNGFGLEEARKSIEIVHEIRNAEIQPISGEYHPFAKLPLAKHPFSNGVKIK